jgi:hypothetical protein
MLIYIIGPISAPGAFEREANIRAAEAAYAELLRNGVSAVCVHSTARALYGTVKEEDAIRSDLEILSRCDGVLRLPGWAMSDGSTKEIRYCDEVCSLPVYDSIHTILETKALQDELLRKESERVNA